MVAAPFNATLSGIIIHQRHRAINRVFFRPFEKNAGIPKAVIAYDERSSERRPEPVANDRPAR
jgi:hypothetical protein